MPRVGQFSTPIHTLTPFFTYPIDLGGEGGGGGVSGGMIDEARIANVLRMITPVVAMC